MKDILKNRSRKFAVEVIKMAEQMPNKPTYWAITNQIIRSSTSVAANYRAVCRAKSDKDFISKMGTVIEEADETLFWMELIEDLINENMEVKSHIKIDALRNLQKEANELVSIFVASNLTIKKRLNNQ
jgi:four helix bundle protein